MFNSVEEAIVPARGHKAEPDGPAGVELCTFVSERIGAKGFSTGLASFKPQAYLPYHLHRFSECIVVIEGNARVLVEGRAYRLASADCLHIPSGVAHRVENESPDQELVAHWSFGNARPSREFVDREFTIEDRNSASPTDADPEALVRYDHGAVYQLSPNAYFHDLFAKRFGSVGICGGHGRFFRGASLPCHVHDFDESITIVKGKAVCLVQGKRYELSDCDTAFIPRGIPHRFLNESDDEMAMVWVYAGSEPDRSIVDARYCSGELRWTGTNQAIERESLDS
jgi:quercetin dioxygenase-like cupin family protein